MKKALSLLMAVITVAGMSTLAFAESWETGGNGDPLFPNNEVDKEQKVENGIVDKHINDGNVPTYGFIGSTQTNGDIDIDGDGDPDVNVDATMLDLAIPVQLLFAVVTNADQEADEFVAPVYRIMNNGNLSVDVTLDQISTKEGNQIALLDTKPVGSNNDEIKLGVKTTATKTTATDFTYADGTPGKTTGDSAWSDGSIIWFPALAKDATTPAKFAADTKLGRVPGQQQGNFTFDAEYSNAFGTKDVRAKYELVLKFTAISSVQP